MQNNVFFLIWASENGAIWADPISLTFFLDVVFQLLRHISGLYATRYQMSVCDDGKGVAWKSFKCILVEYISKCFCSSWYDHSVDVHVYLDICQSIYLFIYLFPRVRREADGGREGVPPRLLLLLLLLGAAGQRVRQPGWSVDIILVLQKVPSEGS